MTEQEKKLSDELDVLIDIKDEMLNNDGIFPSYEGFRNHFKEINLKIRVASQNLRLIKTPEFSKLSDFGDVMNIKDFIENCRCGGFIDYDGFGYYVKDGQESNIEILPSDVISGNYRKDFDTIIWFNR